MLFETAPGGDNPKVSLSRWTDFRRNNFNTLYNMITYRELRSQRSGVFCENLAKYVVDMLGVRAISNRKNGSLLDFAKCDGIYCAELVGSAYQVLGLLSTEIDCTTIRPDSFQRYRTSSQPLPLKSPATFSEEYLVDFALD